MNIELILDNRENKLIELLPNARVKQMEIGDIIFELNGDPILIIERKTVTDLSASIIEGRSREQKARLLNSGIPRNRILYLIEGNVNLPLNEKIGSVTTNQILGSIINTQYRDGIAVYKTSCITETLVFLRKILDKLTKEPTMFYKYLSLEEGISSSEYSSTLKTSKKANMTPHVWFITQLSLIPQITSKIADVIVAEYKTVFNLINSYTAIETEDGKKNMLVDLTYNIANNKVRKIGPKISARIYEFMHF